MSENRDNFIKSLDDSQCGITYKMESVYSMLKDKDLELYLKLVRCSSGCGCVLSVMCSPALDLKHRSIWNPTPCEVKMDLTVLLTPGSFGLWDLP